MYTRTETDVEGNTRVIAQTPYLLAGGGYVLIDEGGEVPEGATVAEVVPPPSTTYQQELADLNAWLQEKTDAFNKAFAIASLSDGPSEEDKKLAIRSEYQAVREQYASVKASLKTKYGL